MFRRLFGVLLCFSLIALLALAGCKGGGGGGGSSSGEGSGGGDTGGGDTGGRPSGPDTDSGTDTTIDPPAGIRATSAGIVTRAYIRHAQNIQGFGSLVAVIDTGIALSIADLSRRIADASTCVICDHTIQDTVGHGTAVASVIASEGVSTGVLGVAPRSELLVIRADADENRGVFLSSDVINAIDYAVEQDADIINLSLGGSRHAGVEAAIERAVDAGAIVVMGTGNGGATVRPTDFTSLVGTYGPTAIAVTAVDANNELADFAQPCDISNPAYCLAAPGVNVAALDVHGNVIAASGTSISAAIVSGAMALMREYFPNLDTDQIVQIVLETAQDLGAPGIDRVYGRGLLDIVAALSPVGELTVASIANNASLQSSGASAGMALGDGLQRIQSLQSVEIKDAYDRSYIADVTGALSASSTDLNDLNLLQDMRRDVQIRNVGNIQLSYANNPASRNAGVDRHFSINIDNADSLYWGLALAEGHQASDRYQFSIVNTEWIHGPFRDMRDRHISFHAGAERGGVEWSLQAGFSEDYDGDRGMGQLSMAVQLGQPGQLRPYMGLSVAREDKAMLGTTLSGVFGSFDQMTSTALTVGATYQSDKFDLFLAGSYGVGHVDMAEQGLVQRVSNPKFSAWGAGIGFNRIWSPKDRLMIGVSQPLRIEKAHLALYNGSAEQIAPSGRQTNLEISYRTQTKTSDLRTGLVLVNEPGHLQYKKAYLQAGFLATHRF